MYDDAAGSDTDPGLEGFRTPTGSFHSSTSEDDEESDNSTEITLLSLSSWNSGDQKIYDEMLDGVEDQVVDTDPLNPLGKVNLKIIQMNVSCQYQEGRRMREIRSSEH